MKFFLALVSVLLFGACSSFQQNERALKSACKAGVETYDDGQTSFSCYQKEVKKESSNESSKAN
jgi:hypothetical protein